MSSSDVLILNQIPENIKEILTKRNLLNLRPSQEKSIKKGLFKNNHNQVVCTPTGSGKTLVAELAMLDTILNKKKRVVYIVPLKALASEKFREFKEQYSSIFNIRISVGELQTERFSYDYDLLLVTAEKFDSLIRHNRDILENLGLVIADEIHLLNDDRRGPTLEILLSIFKTKYPRIRIIGLSATIGNSKEIAKWLRADLVADEWRPVELQQHVLLDNNLIRYK
jgi:helicase